MKHTASENATSKSSTVKRAAPKGNFVVCVNNETYEASLEVGKLYRSLPTRGQGPRGWIRIIDESGEDFLFPSERFVPITVPARAQRALGMTAVT